MIDLDIDFESDFDFVHSSFLPNLFLNTDPQPVESILGEPCPPNTSLPKAKIPFCPIHSVLFSLMDELSGGNLPKYVAFEDEDRLGVRSFGTTTYRFASLINYYQSVAPKSDIKEDAKWRNLSEHSIHELEILSEQFKTLDDYRKMFVQYDIQAFEDALWNYLNKHYTFENGSFKRHRHIN